MKALSKQAILSVLIQVTRSHVHEKELRKMFNNQEQIIDYLLKEELIQTNKDGYCSMTEKGLHKVRHMIHKRPHLTNEPKKKSSKRRGLIQMAILQLLKEEPRYGYQIMKLLEERSEGLYSPSAGTIYPALQDLLEKEFISYELRSGKKVYSLHSNGLGFLENSIDDDEEFWNEWRFRLMWKQSKDAVMVREEFEKLQLEFHYAIRHVMEQPEKMKELAKIIEESRQQLIRWSNAHIGGQE